MGEFQPKESFIDTKKIAEQYAEGIRKQLAEFKEKKLDPHFDDIDTNELTMEDLMAIDKLIKRKLTEEEFEKYRSNVSSYCQEQREKLGRFDEFRDSRANLRAWISNKLMSFEYERRHPEKPHQELFIFPKK